MEKNKNGNDVKHTISLLIRPCYYANYQHTLHRDELNGFISKIREATMDDDLIVSRTECLRMKKLGHINSKFAETSLSPCKLCRSAQL